MSEREDLFLSQRGRLLGLAYRMLGVMSEAEDAVQDAWLKFAAADCENVRSPEGYLVTIVTRLCLDRLKSAQRRREVYVGPWLPEPVADCETMNPQTALEHADDLSFALLMTLERLSPPERAAFLLHDVFGEPYSAIAHALGKSEAACRQIASRARKAVRAERNGAPSKPTEHKELLKAFMAALASGENDALKSLLAEDAVLYTDGGGVKSAALNPIFGADRVMRFFVGVVAKGRAQGKVYAPVMKSINALPGMLLYLDGALEQTISINVRAGKIGAVYVVRNPEKLGAVGAAPV